MDTFCERHGTWHAPGGCATIDALRAQVARVDPRQLTFEAIQETERAALGYVRSGEAPAR